MKLESGLSLWGGLDPSTGVITDPHHPQHQLSVSGRVVAMTVARGSSSSSSILAEALRVGTAPAGFLLNEPDSILQIGALVGRRLYGVDCPIWVGPTPNAEGIWVIDDGGPRPE